MTIQIDESPIEYYPFRIVLEGGQRDSEGKRKTGEAQLEIIKGVFHSPALDLDALIVTSDLQGMVWENDTEYLLGEKLADFLTMLFALECPHLKPEKTGIILCGDLFALSEKRGGLGDVRPVWRSFSTRFKWVAGVAGNHDDFGSKKDFALFKQERGIHYINREVCKIDKIEIGGISGIMGAPDKPNRLPEEDFLKILKQILLKQPDIVVLHQGPDFPPLELAGESRIREILETSPPNLILCGHRFWHTPLVTLKNGAQVLNADMRVVVLEKG